MAENDFISKLISMMEWGIIHRGKESWIKGSFHLTPRTSSLELSSFIALLKTGDQDYHRTARIEKQIKYFETIEWWSIMRELTPCRVAGRADCKITDICLARVIKFHLRTKSVICGRSMAEAQHYHGHDRRRSQWRPASIDQKILWHHRHRWNHFTDAAKTFWKVEEILQRSWLRFETYRLLMQYKNGRGFLPANKAAGLHSDRNHIPGLRGWLRSEGPKSAVCPAQGYYQPTTIVLDDLHRQKLTKRMSGEGIVVEAPRIQRNDTSGIFTAQRTSWLFWLREASCPPYQEEHAMTIWNSPNMQTRKDFYFGTTTGI